VEILEVWGAMKTEWNVGGKNEELWKKSEVQKCDKLDYYFINNYAVEKGFYARKKICLGKPGNVGENENSKTENQWGFFYIFVTTTSFHNVHKLTILEAMTIFQNTQCLQSCIWILLTWISYLHTPGLFIFQSMFVHSNLNNIYVNYSSAKSIVI